MTSNINIGLIGFGNVGQGVFSIIKDNQSVISQRIGRNVCIKKIGVRSIDKYSHLVDPALLTNRIDDIINDETIDIIVEVIGGETPAFDYIMAALNNKKYVVTANKNLIAKHKQTFFNTALKNNVDIFFEASVGGGIPIIKSFKVGYSANSIQSVYGILNGTTNYILTQLSENQMDYITALKQAQNLGFAEADPTADVSGQDAAYKIVILTAVALKVDIQVDDVYVEGIEKITLTDVNYCNELGYSIRLIGKASQQPSGIFVAVYPTAIESNHPLSTVRNEFNAIFSTGNMVGESMIYGKGAGSLPTGSAVVSDILDIAFDLNQHHSQRNIETNMAKLPVASINDNSTQFYCRIITKNEQGVLQKITEAFTRSDINIKKIIQKDATDTQAEIVMILDTCIESKFNETIDQINAFEIVDSIPSVIRVGL